jgi:hypothetical protein
MALAASSIDASRVATRDGMSYIEAYDARATLIKVFGYGGWSYNVDDADIVQIERDIPNSRGGTTNFRVTAKVRGRLYIPQLEVQYGGVAVASQNGAQIGEVCDFAIKTADSDAFKRCAMNLGTQFGLSLYNNGALNDVVGAVYAPGFEFQVPEKRAMAAKKFAEGEFSLANYSPEAKELLARALKMGGVRQDDVPMSEGAEASA